MSNIVFAIRGAQFTLIAHRNRIDALARKYKIEKQAFDDALERDRQSGIYSESYLEEKAKSFKPSIDYTAEIKTTSEANIAEFNRFCDEIKEKLDTYFRAPVSSEFSNTVMAIKTTGLALTDMELQTLQKSATSYIEQRIFNELAISRKDVKGNPNPYPHLVNPADIETVMRQYEEFKYSGLNMLKIYAGRIEHEQKNRLSIPEVEDAILYDYLPNSGNYPKINKALSGVADSSLKNNYAGEFINFLMREGIANEDMLKGEDEDKLKPLTDDEKALIDLIIEPDKYPYSVKSRVVENSKNPILKELFLKDERLADFVPIGA